MQQLTYRIKQYPCIEGPGPGRLAVLGEEPVAPPGRGGIFYIGRAYVGHAEISAEAGFGVRAEGFEHGEIGGVGVFRVGVAVADEERYLGEGRGEDALGWDTGEEDGGGEVL